ncbi:hypothetical protein JJL56_31020 [Azospirillum sp. YIM DDC1]|uniref:DUF2868 domain-containing protein n=1 Tax=Azospirillum aestuarii TaxID=2802052 RepID=A0ABS1I897_9PROT|nr:hypothetical protein [Azospirillum aestuarii]MBK4723288.1 hypothetical protein [Azospirillum aestuarii]
MMNQARHEVPRGGGQTDALIEAIERFGFSSDQAGDHLRGQVRWLRYRAGTAPWRAAVLVALAWGVPLLLTASAGTAAAPLAHHPFLLDWGAWARFVLAIAIFTLMDRQVDEQLKRYLRHFVAAPLLTPQAMAAAAEAVARAIRRGRSPTAATACALIAFGLSAAGAAGLLRRTDVSWLVTGTEDARRLTAAAWWCVLVSSPLFWFLLLRWLWRHVVWGLLLRSIARVDLRLVVTHPDGAGGLAFLGEYPNVFAALVFAMSASLGAAVARAFQQDAFEVHAYSYLMAGWLACILLLFALPLAAFVRPLRALKEKTLLTGAAQATNHFRREEREILGRNLTTPDDPGVTGEPAQPNPSALIAAAKKMSIVPYSRTTIVPLGVAALLPLIAAGATQLPFQELWKVAKRLLLL